jgi:hypothetical protein
MCADLKACDILFNQPERYNNFRLSCVNGTANPETNIGELHIRLKQKS